jgi:hypothetical protein
LYDKGEDLIYFIGNNNGIPSFRIVWKAEITGKKPGTLNYLGANLTACLATWAAVWIENVPRRISCQGDKAGLSFVLSLSWPSQSQSFAWQ